MTSFYVACAEEKLDLMCQALNNMRLLVGEEADGDAAIRQEMLEACEAKAGGMKDKAVAQLQHVCTVGQDIDQVLTSFFLCTELGAATTAVPAFTECLSRIFQTQAHTIFDRVCASKSSAVVNEHGYIARNFYVEAMSEILTGSTDIMNAVADVTSETEVLQQVLRPIHDTCAELILEIVHLYAIDARMTAWERRAIDQARREPRKDAKEDDVETDESLQMMDLFLDELSFIIRVIMSYTSFLKTVCEGLDDDRSSPFHVKTQELNGVYLILERFYIFQSVHKATAIAEPQELEPNVYVSSIVEDVSFVLNKSFFRSSQCMNYHTALSVVIALVDALESMYLPSLLELPTRANMIPLPPSIAATDTSGTSQQQDTKEDEDTKEVSFSDMLLQAVDEDLSRTIQEEARLIMAINSAFMSGEFVESLEAKVDDFSTSSFPQETSIVACLPKHISELTETFRSIVENEVQEVLSRGIRKQMHEVIYKQMTERFEYVLTTEQYDAFGIHGSPLNKLIENEVMKNKVLRRYQVALCDSPFERLVGYVVEDLTKWLVEALLASRKPCNDLGALQLEREVTEMLHRVSEFVKEKSLRGAFTRLFQVVLILNLMHPQHVLDYLISVQEELELQEIETLLHMRVDFKADDVSRVVSQMYKAEQ